MQNVKIETNFIKLGKALAALEQIVVKPADPDRSNIDATIQRFEFTIELFWKLLKSLLESKGVEVQYPKDVLKEAYIGHLIDHEDIWLSMLADRNLTSHTYDAELADRIYAHICVNVAILRETYDKLLNSELK